MTKIGADRIESRRRDTDEHAVCRVGLLILGKCTPMQRNNQVKPERDGRRGGF